MPFCGKLWVDRREIVDTGNGTFSRAIRATDTTASAPDTRLPLVAFAAHPPDFFRRAGGYLCRREIAVFRGMPFCSKLWVDCREIVESLKRFSS